MSYLHRYPSHRDSGVSWLGEIPSHWQLAQGGALLQRKNASNRGMIENTVLSLSYGRIVIKPPERLHGLVPESFETYQVIDPGDIIVRPTDLQNDWNTIRVGISHNRGIITSAYLCLRTREPLTAEYAHLLLLGYDLKKVFYGMGSGLRQNLDWSDFKCLPVLLPPPEEQKAIVATVHRLDSHVRRFIRNRRGLIEVLGEHKQAIINRAVTRGLDPNAPLKPSGIDWLGEVPEHWNVIQVRRRWSITDCKHLTVPFVDDGIALASVREVQRFDLNLAGCKQTTEEWYSKLIEGGRSPRRGDLIYCRNVSVGACAYVNTDERLAMGQDVCLIRSNSENQRFLNYFLHSGAMKGQLTKVLVGSTFNRINVSEVKSLIVTLPPKAEQDTIVEQLDAEVKELERPIEVAQREIDLIREYRTRLIADVVTGKVDVRHLAPQIEEAQPERIEPIDEADEGIDDEMPEHDDAQGVEEVSDADD